MVAKCRGDGRKPVRHSARVVVVMLARPSRRHHQHRSSYCLRLGRVFGHQGRLLGETGIRKPPDALLPGSQPGPKLDLLSGRCGRVLAARQDTPRFASALRSCATRARENPFRRGLVKANGLQTRRTELVKAPGLAAQDLLTPDRPDLLRPPRHALSGDAPGRPSGGS